MAQRNLTLDDVAAAAGVARVTVSRVVNNHPEVSEQTRQRVADAIARLGYSVNRQARALAIGAVPRIILFRVADPDREPNSYYDAGLELGALRACMRQGLDLASRTIDPSRGDMLNHLEMIVRDERPSGVILPPPLCDLDPVRDRLDTLRTPFAAISAGPSANADFPSVGIDDYAAGRAIADHLHALGHRRFGFLAAPASHVSAAMRFDGFRDRLGEMGIALEWTGQGDFTFHSGIEKAHELIDDKAPISALACANDDMAAGAMLTFHREGLKLPGDLSITGFDDTPVSQIVWPPLTTIRQPIQSFGEEAVRMLIADPDMRGGDARRIVPFELVERESTAPPASR